jgi:parvulin-like peptidyl-prolyl isomerase
MPSRTGTAAVTAISIITAALLLLILLSAEGCSGAAVTVNGREIPASQLDRLVAQKILVMKKKNPAEFKGPKADKMEKETERSVATELARTELMREQAQKMGLAAAAAAEARRRLEAERAKLGDDKFAAMLKSQGMTEQEYLEQIEDQVIVEMLGQRVSSDVTATYDEAESYYLTHKGLFSLSSMVHLAHILVDSEGQAQMVLDQIKRGEDFGRLASQVSEDMGTKQNGGDMGWVEKGSVDPALDQEAFALPTGQVSGVVKTSDGYQILKVLERRDAYTPPFSQVRERALTDLINLKKDEKFSDWLRTVYANAQVKVNGGIGTWDPALGEVVSGR